MINSEDWASALHEWVLRPVGLEPRECYWVVRKEAADRNWYFVYPPGVVVRPFSTRDKAEEAARAAADHPECLEVRVIRVAQEIVARFPGPSAKPLRPGDGE